MSVRPVRASDRRRQELLDALVEIVLRDGFERLSVEDMARRLGCSKSTLYVVAESKHLIVTAAVRAFFRRSTDRVEAQVRRTSDPVARVGTYLESIATELSAASPRFFADLESHPSAGAVYRRNTEAAADRVRSLLADAGDLDVDPVFVGAVVTLVMEGIHRGRVTEATGLGDAEAYRDLARLLTAGLR